MEDMLKMVMNELGIKRKLVDRLIVSEHLAGVKIFDFGAGAKLIKTKGGWKVKVAGVTREYALLIDAVNEFARLTDD